MDEDIKTAIKYAAIAAGAYFVYQWLQSSGLWASWFGGATTFTDATALMNYCQANPTGSASYTQSNGVTSTATCAQWIAANGDSTTSPAIPASPAASLGSNYQTAISAMQAAAGNDLQTISNWAYYWQNGTAFSGSPAGYGVPGSISSSQLNQIVSLNGGNAQSAVSSEQFVAWVAQTATSAAATTGTSGLLGFAGGWVN